MIFPVRSPAHLELRPLKNNWETISGEFADTLSGWTGLAGRVERLISNVPKPQGYYRITPERNHSFFVKVLPIGVTYLQREVDRTARWLYSQGIFVSCLIDSFPKYVPGEFCILAYQYVEGRYANETESDLARLGAALAALHRALRTCPWRNKIRDRGLRRDKQLAGMFAKLREGVLPIETVPYDALCLLKMAEPRVMEVLADEPQVVHGDLNYGNVLFGDKAKRVVFLDLEDTRTSWISPLAELSFVIERFALPKNDGLALQLSGALIGGYISGGGVYYRRSGQLADMLRALSVRSLLLLIFVQENRAWSVPISEWNKFISLYHQATARSMLLENISSYRHLK